MGAAIRGRFGGLAGQRGPERSYPATHRRSQRSVPFQHLVNEGSRPQDRDSLVRRDLEKISVTAHDGLNRSSESTGEELVVICVSTDGLR